MLDKDIAPKKYPKLQNIKKKKIHKTSKNGVTRTSMSI